MIFQVRELVTKDNGKQEVKEGTRLAHIDGNGQNSHLVMGHDEVIWVETPFGTIRISTIHANAAAVEVYGGSAKTITFRRI
jgi:hypothetical protein